MKYQDMTSWSPDPADTEKLEHYGLHRVIASHGLRYFKNTLRKGVERDQNNPSETVSP